MVVSEQYVLDRSIFAGKEDNFALVNLSFSPFQPGLLFWSILQTRMGKVLLLCDGSDVIFGLGFCVGGEGDVLEGFRKQWPCVMLKKDDRDSARFAHKKDISICLVGTAYQFSVWRALCQIKSGEVVSYSQVAEMIGSSRACRSVATAIAKNPVAWLVPCHRVLPASGAVGKFRYGYEKKRQLLIGEGCSHC